MTYQMVTIDRRSIAPPMSESHWTASDGWHIRRMDWPAVKGDSLEAMAKGSVLFFPGRGDFYEKYLGFLGQFVHQDWNIVAGDWRGQARSGRNLPDAHIGHIEDFSIWVDDLADIWQQFIAEMPAPHILIGHSMGGHIISRALLEKRIAPDAVILSAPMLMPSSAFTPDWALYGTARMMCAVGDPNRMAWKTGEKPGQTIKARQKILTHDNEKYADEIWWREERPELFLGPPSWRWVERAIASGMDMRKGNGWENCTTPILFFSTRYDALVSHRHIAEASRRAPHAILVEFGREAAHEIFRESDDILQKVMAECFDFLAPFAAQS